MRGRWKEKGCPGQLRQRAGVMIGGGRGEGRHSVAGGAVLLPDGTANRRCLLPFSQLENCTTEKLRLRRGLVTEQEPNPDLPLSVADSQ